MAQKKSKKPSFEDSIDQIESIVTSMEEENLPLEALLTNYEDGQELLCHCQSLIDNARERIEVVRLNSKKSENKLASKTSTNDTLPSQATSDDTRLL